MVKKRLIGVVTVKDGWAVQSFGYKRYLPLGKPECLVENLDRWGTDEILVQVIDRSKGLRGPDFDVLQRLARLGLVTPLIYGGGISTIADGVQVIQSGADRLTVDALLHDQLPVINGLSEQLGAQAVIGSLPVAMGSEGIEWLDYRNKIPRRISQDVLDLLESGVISEVMISDWKNEGYPRGFDQRLIQEFPMNNVSLIAFGGLSEAGQLMELLKYPNLSAVGIGNFLSYREHAVQKYREALVGMPLRPSVYDSKHFLCHD